jgi:hypothetical protein
MVFAYGDRQRALLPPHSEKIMPLNNLLRDALGTYRGSQPRIRPSGRIFPNGEFSLGYTREGDADDGESEWKWANEGRYLTGDQIDERLAYMHDLLDEVQKTYWAGGDVRLLRLTLSSVSNSHIPLPVAKNGLKGLTGYGAKMLRSGCFLLEERLGKEDCVMITLTVPTLGKTDRIAVARSWGQITNRLVQYLSRQLIEAGRPAAIAGCVEIQTARLAKYRQAYLHLHLVCPAYSNTGGRWAIDAVALRSWWKKCLERTIKASLPQMPRVETAIVQKSVEGYLGKYMSKGTGGDLAQFIGDLGQESVPGQWWFMSAPLRGAVKSATAVGGNAGALLDALVNHLLEFGTGEGFEYVRHIDCELGGKPVTVGFVGRLAPGLRVEVFAMLDRNR